MATQAAIHAEQPGEILSGAGRLLRASIRRHQGLVALILAYALACYGAGWLSGGSAVIHITFYAGEFALLIAAFATVVVLVCTIRAMVVVRPSGSLYPAIWQELARNALPGERLGNFLVPVLLGPLFFSSFGSFKRLIPYIAPFSWDEAFMRWDRWLHGGVDPWVLLQPLFGTPLATSALNAVYNAWFFVMFFTFIWQAMSLKRQALRMQFLTSFVLTWIVGGTLFAILLSSAGPCYFGRVTGLADPYLPLMDYLRATAEQVPVWSVAMQEVLWQNHLSRGTMLGSGISAMPSMHVGMAVLLALFGWRIGPVAGAAYSLFALMILIGSVQLGWHYAIDGYVAALVAAALWFATGWALRRAEA